MELRHLRYFVAVAEEGSLTEAAERRLHTAQPSLSRQMRDLEAEVGVKLFDRKARGIELTAAGQVFFDHARLMLMQLDAALEAARRAEQPNRSGFVVGFVAGEEVVWLPDTLRILREEAPGVDITISSLSSPELANALMQGKMDVALLRRETQAPGLAFKFLVKEPLVAIMPANHRLAAKKTIDPKLLAHENFIAGSTKLAPVLKATIAAYAEKMGIVLNQRFDAENVSGGMTLVAMTGGVTLLPSYVTNLMIPSVVARPLSGEPPTIDLMMGYSRSNTSTLLKRFIARSDELVALVSQRMAR